jgi:hypothetical protein
VAVAADADFFAAVMLVFQAACWQCRSLWKYSETPLQFW